MPKDAAPRIRRNVALKNLSAIRIGGPAHYFAEVANARELESVAAWARVHHVPWRVIGGGTNIIPDDRGFRGLIIKNRIERSKLGRATYLGAGNNLFAAIQLLNRKGLAGIERMAGIPGTVGGAIHGSAGAYGQEIKDRLLRVKIFDGVKTRWIPKIQCKFGYRESIFKRKKHWVILGATFAFKRANPKKLAKLSNDIVKLRAKKYRPGLLCPGSFFKNIPYSRFRVKQSAKPLHLDPLWITYGKIPAGFLLERIGAKGMRRGSIAVATHHGNLIFNAGKGNSRDLHRLARLLKARVKKEFGISLEEEVQYLPRNPS